MGSRELHDSQTWVSPNEGAECGFSIQVCAYASGPLSGLLNGAESCSDHPLGAGSGGVGGRSAVAAKEQCAARLGLRATSGPNRASTAAAPAGAAAVVGCRVGEPDWSAAVVLGAAPEVDALTGGNGRDDKRGDRVDHA
jgi:hypothetical protein